MSISLRRGIYFYIPSNVVGRVVNQERLDSIWDEEIELKTSDAMSRIKEIVSKGLTDGTFSKAEAEDIEYSLLVGKIDNKSESESFNFYEFVDEASHFDNSYGCKFATYRDLAQERFKNNIDWYQNTPEMDFKSLPVIASVHKGKPCLAKKIKGELTIVYEDELKEIYRAKKKEDPEQLTKTEFYKAMKKMGYINYVNPSYYVLAKLGDFLLPGVDKKSFNKSGRLSVLMIWR